MHLFNALFKTSLDFLGYKEIGESASNGVKRIETGCSAPLSMSGVVCRWSEWEDSEEYS